LHQSWPCLLAFVYHLYRSFSSPDGSASLARYYCKYVFKYTFL
jgi:hypothetical protein